MVLNPRKRGELQAKSDRYMASGLMKDLGIREFYTEVKVKVDNEEITDLDLYLPDIGVWVELTTTMKDIQTHFYEKVGKFATFGDDYSLFFKSFDPQSGEQLERKLDGKVEKMFYISLYPLRELSVTSKFKLSTFHIVSPDFKDRLSHKMMDPKFEDKLRETYEKLLKRLGEFLQD